MKQLKFIHITKTGGWSIEEGAKKMVFYGEDMMKIEKIYIIYQ